MAKKMNVGKNNQAKKQQGYLIAIDGPAGAGKSTVSKKLAQSLRGRLLDTGAMYRALTYFVIQEKATEDQDFVRIAKKIRFSCDRSGKKLLVNGKVLGAKLRSERVSKMVSQVSRVKKVRDILTAKQRELGKHWSQKVPVVVEGRDIGTVVFPKLKLKFFITANEKERAKRRYLQLRDAGVSGLSLEAVLKQQRARDRKDSRRKHAPLRMAKDAIRIDTSKLEIPDVVEKLRAVISEVQG